MIKIKVSKSAFCLCSQHSKVCICFISLCQNDDHLMNEFILLLRKQVIEYYLTFNSEVLTVVCTTAGCWARIDLIV